MLDNSVSTFNLEDVQCSAVNYSLLSHRVPKWKSWLFITWYGFSSATSIFLNLGVFVIFFRHKNLRTTGNSFFLCLAAADFLIGWFVIPWKITCYMIVPQPIGIKLMVIFVDYLLSVAFLSICGLTYERYQAIINPLTYPFKVNSKTIRIAYVLIWVLPMMQLVRCIWFLSPGMSASSNDSKFSTFLTACIFIVTVTVILAYCCIFREANKQVTHVKETQRITKTAQTCLTRKTGKARLTKAFRSCLAVTLCFTCCWIPRAVFMGRMFLRYPRSSRWDLITFGLMVLSSSLNPILYSLYNHDIRTAILNSTVYSRLLRIKR